MLRKSAIFAFPQEFASLQAVLADFLRQVFSGGGNVEAAPRVRGVYFTSGTQEGSPIDRVMGALCRSFGIDQRAQAIAPGRGKSYFLHRLLKDVVFAERGLGAYNPVAERRGVCCGCRRWRRWACWRWSSASAGSSAAPATWTTPSRWPNACPRCASRAEPAAAGGRDVSALPLPLAQLRDAAKLDAFALDDPPLLNGLGLYQGDKLDAGAQIAYHRLLQKALVPRVATRLEERLRAASKDNLRPPTRR